MTGIFIVVPFAAGTASHFSEYGPKVLALPNGRFVVAWNDFALNWTDPNYDPDANFSLRAQIFTADGVALSEEFLIAANTSNTKNVDSLTLLSGGRFLAVWTIGDFPSQNNPSDTVARIFASDGTPISPEFIVDDTNIDWGQVNSDVTTLVDGSFVVTWGEKQGINSNAGVLRGQLFSSTGTRLGDEFYIDAPIPSSPSPSPWGNWDTYTYYDVIGLAGGGFVVTWFESIIVSPATGWFGIFFQRFDASGEKVGDKTFVASGNNGQGAARDPSAAALENGDFVLTWTAVQSGVGVNDVWVQRFGADGVARAAPANITNGLTNPNVGFKANATAAALPDGGFVVVWAQSTGLNADYQKVMARFLDADGDARGAEVTLASGQAGSTERFSVDVLADGRLIVSWSVADGEGSNTVGVVVTAPDARPPLFTNAGDVVDFNTAALAQFSGSFTDALDGNDNVRLPNTSVLRDQIGWSVQTVFDGGLGDDTVFAGAVGSRIQGGAGGDTLTGGVGADVLSGGDGPDNLTGGGGLDELRGGADNDYLDAVEPDGDLTYDVDLLEGGPGVDTFLVDNLDRVADLKADDVLLFFSTKPIENMLVEYDPAAGVAIKIFASNPDGSVNFDVFDVVNIDDGPPTDRMTFFAFNTNGLLGVEVRQLAGPEAGSVASVAPSLDASSSAIARLADKLGANLREWVLATTAEESTKAVWRDHFGVSLSQSASRFMPQALATAIGEVAIDLGEITLNIAAGHYNADPAGLFEDLVDLTTSFIFRRIPGADLAAQSLLEVGKWAAYEVGPGLVGAIADAIGDAALAADAAAVEHQYLTHSGDEVRAGTGGVDRIWAFGGDDQLTGGAGRDTLNGGYGNDQIDGGMDDDELIGGDGQDVVSGGGGDDVIVGGSGAGDDAYDGGDGADTVRYSSALFAIVVDLTAGFASGADIDNDSLVNIENIVGGAGADLLIGDGGANMITGGAGDDTAFTGAGADDVILGDGDDGAILGDGDDAAVLGAGADYAYGGEGVDSIDGGAGSDILLGENGNDQLTGGSEQDYLFGLADNDTLNGGGGVDVLIGDIGDDIIDGGEGDDYIYAGLGADDATGGLGNDLFVMEGGDDIVVGGAGDDFVYGGADNDTINGGDGTDILLGETGNDVITGGLGVDYVFLGSGDDQYVIDKNAAGLNVTVLFDFTAGAGSADTLRLLNTGWTTIAEVQANTFDTGNGYSIIVLDVDTQIWMIGLTPDQLAAGDAVFV